MGSCGPQKRYHLLGRTINFPTFVFDQSCKKHDICYEKGGKQADRVRVDDQFYRDMRSDAFFASQGFNPMIGYIIYQYYLIWVRLYYKAVQKSGSKYFNYH